MDQYDNFYTDVNNISTNSLKFLELGFIFVIIFSVVCKVTNYNVINSAVLTKIHTFIFSKLSNKDECLISYRDEISFYDIKPNQVDIVISDNISNEDLTKMPCNHISNISPTNNFPMSTPSLKIDENGNIIPNDTFLKSNPFLIPSNTVKRTEKKENPTQYPTIIVTLPNEAILPYSPKIPMDIYYREGWVDYNNPDSSSTNNTFNPREVQKRKNYDYNYLAPLIPKNHFSLKLQHSFMTKTKVINKPEIKKDELKSNVDTNSNAIHTTSEENEINSDDLKETIKSNFDDSEKLELDCEANHLVGNYYIDDQVNEYVEKYELINHAFWWQEDYNQQAIAV